MRIKKKGNSTFYIKAETADAYKFSTNACFAINVDSGLTILNPTLLYCIIHLVSEVTNLTPAFPVPYNALIFQMSHKLITTR